jgi:hypothetical protein
VTRELTAERKLGLVAERLNLVAGNWFLDTTYAGGPVLRGPAKTAVRLGANHTG